MKKLLAPFLLCLTLLVHTPARADICPNKFPNFITDVCWSCMFPFKIFGKTIIGSSNDDFPTNAGGPVCACLNQLKIGVPVSFWEPSYLVDVHTSPGCLPTLGGLRLPLPWNTEQEGVITSSAQQRRAAFRHSAYYVSPLMFLLEVVLDDSCADRSPFDVGWTSEFDPTWDDDQMAMIKMPISFAFSSLPAIMAAGLDSTAAATGFPLNEIFWHAGSQGPMYPLTGHVADFKSMDQTGRLLATRMLAMAHTMRSLDQQLFAKGAGRSYACEPGEAGCSSSVTRAAMCAGSPFDMPVQLVMPKKQYKLQRIFPTPGTDKSLTGSCCQPIGRTTVLTESNTQLPLSGYKDFGYSVFRKRDCCAGVVTPATLQ